MPLNDLSVRNAKALDKDYKLSDGGGLYVLVRKNGTKAWQLGYRYGGKQKTFTIGAYPTVGLAEARDKRTAAKKQIASGLDPSTQKRLDRIALETATANTFEMVADEWLARGAAEGMAPSTIAKHTWLLRLAKAQLGSRPISQITSAEILSLLRSIERQGKLETANRVRSSVSAVFRHAIRTLRADTDPTLALRGATQAPTVKHHGAILNEAEIGPLMRSISAYAGNFSVRSALAWMARTFVRTKELRWAPKTEIDLEGALWTIPGPRMKMDLPHLVPLSKQCVELAREIIETVPGPLLFPSVRSHKRPISENTLNTALRTMGYEKGDMTGHGFRRMASTRLNEMGWNPDWIERQLAHVEGHKVRRAYNAAEYLDGRTKMMQFWSDYLDRLADDDEDLIG
jgi:integrase